jgi:NAD(P)-dependent dehydrogenase (short-subunit alcohol dehydrogenase family)
MSQLSRFSNKVIIITGAASGMGRATVIRMVAEGGTVIGIDLNESGLEETVQLALKTAENGGSVSYMVGSVSDEKTVIKIVSDVVSKYGKLDVLVNNAGILRSSHTTETSVEEFQTIINTNLLSVFMFCREALPHLIKTQGNIVNLASTSAFFGHPYMIPYAASKGGVVSMTHSLAWEYLKQGVRVNAVAPGGISTPMIKNPFGKIAADVDMSLFTHLARPDGKFGEPENIASVIAMLASTDGNFINGEVIRIDGGNHS